MCDANEKKQKKWFFFSSFNSLSIYFISRWLVSKRLGCANCLVQFCWISCSVHSDSFNTNTYSSAALISNAVFGSNIICTFCFIHFIRAFFHKRYGMSNHCLLLIGNLPNWSLALLRGHVSMHVRFEFFSGNEIVWWCSQLHLHEDNVG